MKYLHDAWWQLSWKVKCHMLSVSLNILISTRFEDPSPHWTMLRMAGIMLEFFGYLCWVWSLWRNFHGELCVLVENTILKKWKISCLTWKRTFTECSLQIHSAVKSIEYSVSSISMWTLNMLNNKSLICFLGKDRKTHLIEKCNFS